jgi:hypothetical protein
VHKTKKKTQRSRPKAGAKPTRGAAVSRDPATHPSKDVAPPDFEALTRLSGRTRLLADHLLGTADALAMLPPTPERNALVLHLAAVVDGALRQYFRIGEGPQAARLALIEAIATVHELGQAGVSGRAPRQLYAPRLVPPAAARLAPAGPLSAARLAQVARDEYATYFPECAVRLDMATLETAITAWGNAGGAPAKGAQVVPKFEAIAAVAASAGLPRVSADTIEREWARHTREVRDALSALTSKPLG